jgi:hypothetical protein
MSAPVGNRFWELRSKHGRDKLFKTPELLREAAIEFFEWHEENPLKEEKVFNYQGEIVRANVSKIRAMTLSGLCLFLGVNEAYFRTFKSQLPEGEQEFNTVISWIESVIYNQKFQGAAADLLNANIISMELGLRQKVDSTIGNPDGSPLNPSVIVNPIQATAAPIEEKEPGNEQ